MDEQEFLFKDLTYAVIGAAMEVHRILGPGFLEAVYQKALAHEMLLRGISYEQQKPLRVDYKGIDAGDFRADFMVDNKVVVEIKATQKLVKADEAQLINYLKATGYRVGMLLNFGTASLEHMRRVV